MVLGSDTGLGWTSPFHLTDPVQHKIYFPRKNKKKELDTLNVAGKLYFGDYGSTAKTKKVALQCKKNITANCLNCKYIQHFLFQMVSEMRELKYYR